MHIILRLLAEGLEKEERDSLVRRVDFMLAELEYLKESKPASILEAENLGWTIKKLEVACCLNSA